jgi:hypothetical protein
MSNACGSRILRVVERKRQPEKLDRRDSAICIRYVVGVEFTHLEPEAYEAIRQFVELKTGPTTRWLAPKKYEFVLSKDGFVSETASLEIKEGNNPPLQRTLRPRP